MKRILLAAMVTVLAFSAFSQQRWRKEGVTFPAPICYGSDKNHESFIDAPDEFLKRLKSTEQKKSSIVVSYIGFEEEPQAAFQYAVEIWEHLIASPIPIYMTARWTSLDEGVLGSCGPTSFFENFEAAPLKDRYYPVALVEKLQGEEITDASYPDMIAQFNSDNEDWYFGVDGNTPIGKYDFVSVVLHEIAHGLGFTGFFYEQDGLGTYGDILPYPGIFDEFVITGSGSQLVDTAIFSNPSASLLQQFRSNNLYFRSESAKSVSNNDGYPRLYAPATFDEGSSIYHLHESTYDVGDTNSLMTPFFDRAEAVHDPGPMTLAMFADMGWVFTSILHDPVGDRELAEAIVIEAEIQTDSEIDSTSVMLIYSDDGFANADTLPLVYSATQGLFVAQLDGLTEGTYEYYLRVVDVTDRTFFLPGAVPDEYFEFKIGADLVAPVVSHQPVKSMLESDLSAEIVVEASDNIGVLGVGMEFILNDGPELALILEDQGGDVYRAILELQDLVDGDSVRYRIIAVDSSSNANQTILPEDGYYTIAIDGLYEAVKTYTNDFNSETRDFILADFSIGVEDLFSNGALHSPHPYPSPDEDDVTYNFATLLKYPIVIDDRAMMSFREVVLVEPGEPGSQFGDDDFWDYVIVEGSKTGTTDWLPLIDGYDSGAKTSWKTVYERGIQGNNSTEVGRASYYINRELSLVANENFQAGDTIFIRFRLFSDPYAHGWGWAIDDLRIQDPPTAFDDVAYSPGEILVFPNPVRDQLFVQGSFKSNVGQLILSVYNGHGQLLSKEDITPGSNQLRHTLDVESLRPGLYLISFGFENGQLITHKFVKQ